jgi:hypothetical protein
MIRMSRRYHQMISICVLILYWSLKAEVKTIEVSDASELNRIFQTSVDSVEVRFQPGEYHLTPFVIVDSTCGNCEDPQHPIGATAGLVVSGNYVKLTGREDHTAIIHTHAGYGIFFRNCKNSIVENLLITDGARDEDGRATDAAIVVKNGEVAIRNNRIFNNIGDSSIVTKNIVGIMGICGRENSDLTITGNEIIRNSWDGIALYRDAKANISDNLIDGVDKASSKVAGGGRGVAIGVTWNAEAVIESNLVKRYWKGIGVFVDANVTARNNLIEDILTWGIAYWDAGKGKPVGIIENNFIYDTGACGTSITRSQPGEGPGRFVNNVIVKTAQNPKYDSPDYYCEQCALSVVAQPDNFLIEGNIFFANRRATDDLPDYDLARDQFKEKVISLKAQIIHKRLFGSSDFAKFLSEF